jgi:hypothetical protein
MRRKIMFIMWSTIYSVIKEEEEKNLENNKTLKRSGAPIKGGNNIC